MFAKLLKAKYFGSFSIETAPVIWFIGLASVVVSLVPEMSRLVQYDAVAIGQGQVWRALTGHLAHWNFDHLIWDLSVFLIIGTICELRGRQTTLICMIGSALAASLYLFFALPEISLYRGLSGVDTGLFALLSVRLYIDARSSSDKVTERMIIVFAAGLLLKLAFELVSGHTVFVDHSRAGFIPIVGAHILGAITGVLSGVVEAQRSQALLSEVCARKSDYCRS